jgi:hypothetical protein
MAVATAISAAVSAGAAVYSATQSPPKPPAPQQPAVAPQAPLYRRQKSNAPRYNTLLAGDLEGSVARSDLLGS